MRKYLLFILYTSLIYADTGITYLDHTYWGGRLGDQLIMFVKAKIVSYYTEIPLYIKYFTYADSFAFWNREKHLSDFESKNANPVVLKRLSNFDEIRNAQNQLFITHYYFQLDDWGDAQKKYDSQEIMDWKHLFQNQELLQEIRTSLKPLKETPLLLPPKDINSVAVHVRKTSGGDRPICSNQLYNIYNLNLSQPTPTGNYSDINYPTKCIPDQYFIDQINYLYERLGRKPLYIFIFTDDENPEQICNLYSRKCNFENVTFHCRTGAQKQALNQVQDLASMAMYDYLIRGGSNFPPAAQLMGNHRLVIYPKSVKWIGKNLIVDKVGIYEKSQQKNMEQDLTSIDYLIRGGSNFPPADNLWEIID